MHVPGTVSRLFVIVLVAEIYSLTYGEAKVIVQSAFDYFAVQDTNFPVSGHLNPRQLAGLLAYLDGA